MKPTTNKQKTQMKEAKSLKTDTKLKILIVPPLKQIEFAKLNAKLL